MPGPCDAVDKACCYNQQLNASYCHSSGPVHVACDVSPPGTPENGLLCARCGGHNMPCCFGSEGSVHNVTQAALALGKQLCNEADMSCMLHSGSPFNFDRCDAVDCNAVQNAET